MSYATKQAMIDLFSERELAELTDDIAHAVIDDAVLGRAIGFADDLVDSKLRERYSVPLESPPAVIVDYACDIARHRLYGDAVPELVEARFRAAMAWLNDIALGRAGLPAESPSGGMPQAVAADRVFSPQTLIDF